MDVCSKWVPMRWPAEWREPALLDVVKGTPVNCLVVPWGAGDAATPIIEQALQLGLALVAEIDAKSDPAAALLSAQKARVSAVALAAPAETKLPVVAWAEKSKLPWKSGAAAFAVADAVWPSIPSKPGLDGAESGPTGAPWVDSNGWFIQLAHALAPGKPVWAGAVPPKADFIRSAQYVLGVSDAYVYGGRWVITLDEKLRSAIRDRKPAAQNFWNAITNTVQFFLKHAEWETCTPYANLAVISDFAGPNEYMGHEVLNLLPRRGVPYRILEKSRATQTTFEGLKGILFVDEEAPSGALFDKLIAFANSGGTLIIPNRWPAPAGVQPAMDVYKRWNIYSAGKGKIAIAKDAGGDPFLIAADSQLLMSRRSDVIRLFNSSTLNCHYIESADGRKAVVHVLNYALRTWGGPVSIALAKRYKTARIWRVEGKDPEPLEVVPAESGVEVHLAPFGVHAAIELEA